MLPTAFLKGSHWIGIFLLSGESVDFLRERNCSTLCLPLSLAQCRHGGKYLRLHQRNIWSELILLYLGEKRWKILFFMENLRLPGEERAADRRQGLRSPWDPWCHQEPKTNFSGVKASLWDSLKKLWFNQTMERSVAFKQSESKPYELWWEDD